VAVAAGLAAMDLIEKEDPYAGLEAVAEDLAAGVSKALDERGVAHTVNREGSLFSLFFTGGAVTDYDSARSADHDAYGRFFHGMLEAGVHLPPSGYEGWFLSTAHGHADVELVVEAARAATSRW